MAGPSGCPARLPSDVGGSTFSQEDGEAHRPACIAGDAEGEVALVLGHQTIQIQGGYSVSPH